MRTLPRPRRFAITGGVTLAAAALSASFLVGVGVVHGPPARPVEPSLASDKSLGTALLTGAEIGTDYAGTTVPARKASIAESASPCELLFTDPSRLAATLTKARFSSATTNHVRAAVALSRNESTPIAQQPSMQQTVIAFSPAGGGDTAARALLTKLPATARGCANRHTILDDGTRLTLTLRPRGPVAADGSFTLDATGVSGTGVKLTGYLTTKRVGPTLVLLRYFGPANAPTPPDLLDTLNAATDKLTDLLPVLKFGDTTPAGAPEATSTASSPTPTPSATSPSATPNP